jgi:lysophospholipase L1-like esterase
MVRLKRFYGVLGIGVPLLVGCLGVESQDGQDSGYSLRQGRKDKQEKVAYVAVGNSLTSGFQNNGLRKDWQDESYPALLARAMDVEDFQLPYIDTPGIGLTRINGQPGTPLFLEGSSILSRPLPRPIPDMLLNAALPRPYNNLGVPGATTLDFLRAYDAASSQSPGNPFFNIVLRGGLFQNATMLRQAVQLDPKVMTLWIGSNDILGGITAGTVVEGVTVTPVAAYTALMDLGLDTLLRETKARIFMANMPGITTIPFVTTVPKVVIGPDFRPVLVNGSPVPLLTQESDVEYVLFPALAAFQRGIGIPAALGGTGQPLPSNLTLTRAEVEIAERLTAGYNAYLARKARDHAHRLTLVDVHGLLEDLKEGRIPGLSGLHPLLDPTGTAFSLDGIHPNSKGYRQVAGLFLEAINGALHKRYRLPHDEACAVVARR